MIGMRITVDDRTARDMLGRIISNLPKANEEGLRIIGDLYVKEMKTRAEMHRFMGILENSIHNKKKAKNERVITAPRYAFYLDRGTRKHIVSLDKHPIVRRWIEQKGHGNILTISRKGRSYAMIRTKPTRFIRDSVLAGNKQFKRIAENHYNQFVRSKGGSV